MQKKRIKQEQKTKTGHMHGGLARASRERNNKTKIREMPEMTYPRHCLGVALEMPHLPQAVDKTHRNEEEMGAVPRK